MTTMQELEEKYRRGGKFSAHELRRGIEFFKELTSSLAQLGPRFALTTSETRRIWYGLEELQKWRRDYGNPRIFTSQVPETSRENI